MKIKKLYCSVIGMILLLVISSVYYYKTDNYRIHQDALNKNFNKWKSSNISHYQYNYSFCGFSRDSGKVYTIKVSNNKIISIFDNSERINLKETEFKYYYTINDMFNKIQQSINQKADSIKIEYDELKGYPKNIYIDWEKYMADEETNFKIGKVIEIK